LLVLYIPVLGEATECGDAGDLHDVAGVVDDDVEPPEVLDRGHRGDEDRRPVGHVECQARSLST
jgi:hypothetical protein